MRKKSKNHLLLDEREIEEVKLKIQREQQYLKEYAKIASAMYELISSPDAQPEMDVSSILNGEDGRFFNRRAAETLKEKLRCLGWELTTIECNWKPDICYIRSNELVKQIEERKMAEQVIFEAQEEIRKEKALKYYRRNKQERRDFEAAIARRCKELNMGPGACRYVMRNLVDGPLPVPDSLYPW